MATVKAGDRVRIVTRPATSDDTKAGLYYEYFGGLTGAVDRTYDDGSVCVDVDLDSLNEAMRERHLAMQETERKRWLNSLSDEARNRLNADQKQLKMSYKILVSGNDLESDKGGKPKRLEAKKDGGAGEDAPSDAPKGPARAPDPAPEAQAGPHEADAPKRLSEADLAAAEEAFLRSQQSG